MLKRIASLNEREIGLLALLVVVSIIFVPKLQSGDPGLTTKERLELEDRNRTTLAQIIAGASAGLYFAFRNLRATERNIDLAEKKLEAERFVEATKMLSSDALFTQIGGIYALGQLARASRDYLGLSEEALVTYIQHRFRLTNSDLAKKRCIDLYAIGFEELEPEVKLVMKTLGLMRPMRVERRVEVYLVEPRKIDLSGILLGSVAVDDANFYGSDFSASSLNHASFHCCELRRAMFFDAQLCGVLFERSDLTEAVFWNADLRDVKFLSTSVVGAGFECAWVHGADLTGAKGLTQGQINKAKGDSTTILPEHLSIPNHWRIKGEEPIWGDYLEDLDPKLAEEIISVSRDF